MSWEKNKHMLLIIKKERQNECFLFLLVFHSVNIIFVSKVFSEMLMVHQTIAPV